MRGTQRGPNQIVKADAQPQCLIKTVMLSLHFTTVCGNAVFVCPKITDKAKRPDFKDNAINSKWFSFIFERRSYIYLRYG